MAADRYVFLSYSRQDSAIAEKLSNSLQQRGVTVWRDLEQIPAGANWMEAIEQGLKGASALIYLASRHAVQSTWMNNEVNAFIENAKTIIIPVIVDDAGEHSMPSFMRKYQWLDIRHGFERVVDQIVGALRGDVTIGAPVTKTENKSKGYVFLNYSETDADFVQKLKTFLKEHGYAYWDYDESDRDYHSQLFLELEGVIREAMATLSVLSEAWKKSRWTVKEYFFSEEIGIPVFLLRAKEMSPTLAVAGVPYIDFVSDPKAGFARLNRELIRKKL